MILELVWSWRVFRFAGLLHQQTSLLPGLHQPRTSPQTWLHRHQTCRRRIQVRPAFSPGLLRLSLARHFLRHPLGLPLGHRPLLWLQVVSSLPLDILLTVGRQVRSAVPAGQLRSADFQHQEGESLHHSATHLLYRVQVR